MLPQPPLVPMVGDDETLVGFCWFGVFFLGQITCMLVFPHSDVDELGDKAAVEIIYLYVVNFL